MSPRGKEPVTVPMAARELVAPREEKELPLRFVTLLPEHYNRDAPQKPRGPQKIGIRTVGHPDRGAARAAAAKAMKAFPGPDLVVHRIDAGNDALGAWMVARGTCKPDDVSKPFFQAGELNIPILLRSETIRFLYDEIEKLSIETSPVARRATSRDLARLGAMALPLGALVRRVLDESARMDAAGEETALLVGPARDEAIVRALLADLPMHDVSPLETLSRPDQVRAEKFLAMVLDQLDGRD
jgi:hypothetical protein